MDDRASMQQQLVAEVMAALLKQVGEQALGDVAEKLKRGDLSGAGEEIQGKAKGAGKALEGLFGK